MPISNHELLARVERLEAQVERLERLGISPQDLEEHLARLKRLEGFMECIESYLDRLERLSVPLSRLEERLQLESPQPRKSNRQGHHQLVQSKVEAKEFLAHLARSTAASRQRNFLFKMKRFAFKRWLLRLGRR